MEVNPYSIRDDVRNFTSPHDRMVVNDQFPYHVLSLGQSELLRRVATSGSTVSLDEAVAIIGSHHCNPYGQIVVLMNRGLIAVDYEDRSHADPMIVLRRT